MKKIIFFLTISSMLVITGCIDPIEDANNTIGAFTPDVNLQANFYMTGAKTAVIENGSAYSGQILIIDEGIRTRALRIESLKDKNAVLSDAQISEVFSDLAIQDKYPLIDAQELDEAPVGSRASLGMFSLIKQVKVDNGIIFQMEDYPIVNKEGINVSIGGHIFLEKPEVDVDYNLFRKRVKVAAHFGESSEIHLNASTPDIKVFNEKEILLGHYVAPIKLFGYPICQVSYALILQIGVLGEMNITARIDQALAADVGLDVSMSEIVPSYNFYPPTGEYYNYTVQGKGNFKAWVNFFPQVGLQILQYNVALVQGDLGAKMQADLNVFAAKDADAMAKVILDCEIHASVWATLLEKPEPYVLFDWSKEFEYENDFLQ